MAGYNLIPIGNKKTGKVIALSQELGSGYVIENNARNQGFHFSRNSHREHFDKLQIGSEVYFFENGHGCVAQFVEP